MLMVGTKGEFLEGVRTFQFNSLPSTLWVRDNRADIGGGGRSTASAPLLDLLSYYL